MPGATDRTAESLTLSLGTLQYVMRRIWTLELERTGWISASPLGIVTSSKLVNLSEPWFPHL